MNTVDFIFAVFTLLLRFVQRFTKRDLSRILGFSYFSLYIPFYTAQIVFRRFVSL
ncbi:hypothetical protein LEP1GSC021_2274 [Leptospira noguchii str. 1993005606]|nr:hypothetical protein LEP1GSC021_2274 [Leptospira noguchii str. 1993005606]